MLRRLKFSGYLSLDITIYHHISPLSPSIMYVCMYIYISYHIISTKTWIQKISENSPEEDKEKEDVDSRGLGRSLEFHYR